MTKDVLIQISGMQFDIEDDEIEQKVAGTYFYKNDKHYVLFDEIMEENGEVVKNIVKFHEGEFEITKKGVRHTSLLFKENEVTSSVYYTPVGSMEVEMKTKLVAINEAYDEIKIKIQYALYMNHSFVSNCEVNFKVISL